MAVTGFLSGNVPIKAFNKEIDWNDGNVKVMLLTSAATPDQDTWIYKSSVTNEHAATGGYTTRGQAWAAGNATAVYTGASNLSTFDAPDTVWTGATITARYAVIYYDTGVDATSPIIGIINFGADVSSTAANFTIQWNAGGIFTFTV
jgi:hypothetical protein